jgi:hypothetical protein
MTRDPGHTGRRSSATISSVLASASAGLGVLLLVVAALAQDVQPVQPAQPGPPQASPSSEPVPPAVVTPGPSFQPGFIDAFGRLLEQGAAKLKSDIQGAQENFDKLGKEARDAAKDATSGFVGLPGARVVSGRELCATAQNGAPDCLAAAAAVCRGKGFQTGKSLDTQSEQKCPARLLLSGRPPNDTDCATEIYVTHAMCQ